MMSSLIEIRYEMHFYDLYIFTRVTHFVTVISKVKYSPEDKALSQMIRDGFIKCMGFFTEIVTNYQ